MKNYLKKSIARGFFLATASMVMITPILSLSQSAFAEEITPNIQNTKSNKEKQEPQYRNVMYYGDWSVWDGQGNQYPKDLPAGLYTHLNFAFLNFDSNGNLYLTDQDAAFGNPVGSGNTWGDELSGAIPALAAVRKENPNMKLGISIGGWSKSANFPTISADSNKRKNFVKNVMKFVKYTGMDFVDIDWEYPCISRKGDLIDNKNDTGNPHASPEDGKHYILLMEELRSALNEQGKIDNKKYELSVALPGTKKQLEQTNIDVKKLFDIIDFGNLMTYDMSGAWDEKASHHTALYSNPDAPNNFSVDSVIQYLRSKDVQINKVIIGAAFYTRGWGSVNKGSDAKHPGLFQEASISGKDADNTPSRGALNEAPLKSGDGGRRSGVWSYRSIDKLKQSDPDLREYWDDKAKAPYLYSESTKSFYTFDNKRSIEEKAAYVKENKLGGIISWMSAQDKDNNGNKVRDELTKTIAKSLFGSNELPSVIEDGKSNNISVDLKVDAGPTDSGKKGYQITVTNKEILEKFEGDALHFSGRYYSTIKKPHFIITTKDGSALTKGDYLSGNVTFKGGKTVVDLSGVYDGKLIKPGTEYKFKLNASVGSEVDPTNIEKVELEQYYNDKTKLSSQIVFDKGEHTENKPKFSGIKDEVICLNSKFDPLKGVTARDEKDGDLTSKIKINGEVNTEKVGIYHLTYSVENSKGIKTTASRVISVEKKLAPSFGVGKGIKWPQQVVAPFVDMAAYTSDPSLSNNGAPNLSAISKQSNLKLFNLGFIQAVQSSDHSQKIDWAWGGFKGLSEQGNDKWQYEGLKKAIKDLRSLGGDVAVSFGGLNSGAFWEVSKDPKVLEEAYKEIVYGYGLTRIDFDVEAGAMNYERNRINAKAVKAVQDQTGVQVTLTLPVMNTGLINTGLNVLKAYLEVGVDLNTINIMAMCYGTSVPDYAQGSVDAIDNTMKQLKNMYKQYANKELTDDEAYSKLGVTPSIGFESEAHPYFTTSMLEKVVSHAKNKKIGELSFWSMNRDAKIDSGHGKVKTPYEFTQVANRFLNNPDPDPIEKPVIYGVKDVVIECGEEFDPRAGVTAVDKVDGDITDKIEIKGSVDINTPGIYNLFYSVKNSVGMTTSVSRKVTVKKSNEPDSDNWDPNKTYVKDDIVIYKDKKYKAKWWTKGEVPGETDVWELLTPSTQVEEWKVDKIYNTGDKVLYKGKKYKAKWWTKGEVPGETDVWELLTPSTQVEEWKVDKIYNTGDKVLYKGKKYKTKWWTKGEVPGETDVWELLTPSTQTEEVVG